MFYCICDLNCILISVTMYIISCCLYLLTSVAKTVFNLKISFFRLRFRSTDCSLIIHKLLTTHFFASCKYFCYFHEYRSTEVPKTKLTSSVQVLQAKDGLLVHHCARSKFCKFLASIFSLHK